MTNNKLKSILFLSIFLLIVAGFSQPLDNDLSKKKLENNKTTVHRSYTSINTNIQPVELWRGPYTIPDVKKFPRPDYYQTFVDPLFKHKTKRVSDSYAFRKEDGETTKKSATLRHHYATSAVWNSDSSKYLLNFGQVRDAETNKLILRVNEYSYLKEHIWSKIDPNVLYGTSANTLKKFNITTKKAEVLHTFNGFGNLSMDNLKILSDDDRYIMISDVEAGGKKIAVYDLSNDKVISQIDDIFAHPIIAKHWHRVIPGISPSGNYVVMIDESGSTLLFDQKLSYLRKLSLGHNHADLGYDAYGNEVLVQTCPAQMIRLDNGQVTNLIGKTYGCGHVSLRNYRQPGWAYFSLSQDPNDNAYGVGQVNEILAVKLDSLGTTVRRLAQPRSTYPFPSIDEQHSAMAVPNPDGSKVMFNSGWDNPQGEINAYVIEISL